MNRIYGIYPPSMQSIWIARGPHTYRETETSLPWINRISKQDEVTLDYLAWHRMVGVRLLSPESNQSEYLPNARILQ